MRKFSILAFVLTIFTLSLLSFPKNIYASINFYRYWFTLNNNNTQNTSYYMNKTSSNIPTVSPTLTPTLTLAPIPTSTPSPTPTPSPKPTIIPTISNINTSTNEKPKTNDNTAKNDVKSYIMNEVNEFRKSKGLYEVKTDTHTCDFAKARSHEITSNFNHEGFNNRISSNSLPYPTFSSVTENIAMNSDYTDVVSKWITSFQHAENMQKDTPFVCVENEGNYYAYEGWKP